MCSSGQAPDLRRRADPVAAACCGRRQRDSQIRRRQASGHQRSEGAGRRLAQASIGVLDRRLRCHEQPDADHARPATASGDEQAQRVSPARGIYVADAAAVTGAAVPEVPGVAQRGGWPAGIVGSGRRESDPAPWPEHADVGERGGRTAVRPDLAKHGGLAEQPGREHAGEAERELKRVTGGRPAIGKCVHQGDRVLWPVVGIGPDRRLPFVIGGVPDEHGAADAGRGERDLVAAAERVITHAHVRELLPREDRAPDIGTRPAVVGQHLITHGAKPEERRGDRPPDQGPELNQAG